MNFERQLELNQLMQVYHFALRTISKDLKMIEVATDRFDVWIDEIEKFLAKAPPEIEGVLATISERRRKDDHGKRNSADGAR